MQYNNINGTKSLYLESLRTSASYNVSLGTTNWASIAIIRSSNLMYVYLDNSGHYKPGSSIGASTSI